MIWNVEIVGEALLLFCKTTTYKTSLLSLGVILYSTRVHHFSVGRRETPLVSCRVINQEEYNKWHRVDDRAPLVDPKAVLDTLRIRLLFAVNVSDWRLSITIKCNLFEFVLRRCFVLQWPLIRCCVVEWGD